MQGNNLDREPYSSGEEEKYSFKDYLNILLNNIYLVIIAAAVCGAIGFIYAFYQPDVYKSSTTLKLSPPKGSVLDAPFTGEINNFANDRFIANEIEIMKSYTIRENVAYSLKKAFLTGVKDSFYLILNPDLRNPNRFSFFNGGSQAQFNKIREVPYYPDTLIKRDNMTSMLSRAVSIDQRRGLDIVEISAESPSPYEAAIMANNYAQAYINLNLLMNRTKVSVTRRFLEQQRKEKYNDLRRAEDTLKMFQQSRGIVELGEQSKQLVNQLGDFDAQKNAKELDAAMYEKSIQELKAQLKSEEPKIADALESSKLEAYLKEVQGQLARLEVNKDYSLNGARNEDERKKINDKYNSDIKELKRQENDKIEQLKNLVTSKSAVEDASKIGLQIIEYQVKLQGTKVSLEKLSGIIKTYEARFNQLPRNIIELAQLQRQSSAYEKLYQMVEEKYQEALVNEQSTIGNVQLIDPARKPESPVGPNRKMITIACLLFGVFLGFGIVVVKNQFANSVKSPDDIQRMNIPLLGWLPLFSVKKNGESGTDLMRGAKDPLSKTAEAFRGIRTRIHFARNKEKKIKTLLVTSTMPSEGKSTVAINLAEIFAQGGKKTLLIDCDLRKPAVHKVFNAEKIPGLTDCLGDLIDYKKIILNSFSNNLYIITSGSYTQNPAEVLDSEQMASFIERLKGEYDFIVIDSPPLLAVTDAEILAGLTDASILVAASGSANREMIKKAVRILEGDKWNFMGVVLNKFKFDIGYGYYYKNYYYYYTDKKKNRFYRIYRVFKKENIN